MTYKTFSQKAFNNTVYNLRNNHPALWKLTDEQIYNEYTDWDMSDKELSFEDWCSEHHFSSFPRT